MLSRFFVSLVVCAMYLCDNHVDGAMTMEQLNNAARGIRNTCVGKTGASPDVVEGMHRGEFPEDDNLQCYAKCVMTVMKSIKNGKPQIEPLLKQINLMMPADRQERTSAVVRHCGALAFNENPCIAAWEFVRCQYNQDPEMFFFPCHDVIARISGDEVVPDERETIYLGIAVSRLRQMFAGKMATAWLGIVREQVPCLEIVSAALLILSRRYDVLHGWFSLLGTKDSFDIRA